MRPRAGQGIAGALVVCLWAAAAGAAEPQPATEVVIHGTVVDAAGKPLAGYPVRLIKTKTTLNLLHFSTGSRHEDYARTETDAEGRFELKALPDPKFDYFYLRFYDPKTFDPVRYSVPADVNITKSFKSKTDVQADALIRDHPDWAKVQSMVAEFGPDSNRGKILRSLGLPEKRQAFPETPGKEYWWYYAKGLCYQLQGDQVLNKRTFEPVLPPRPSA
jgi:hypothetical protein